jgi:hypothetical protein
VRADVVHSRSGSDKKRNFFAIAKEKVTLPDKKKADFAQSKSAFSKRMG